MIFLCKWGDFQVPFAVNFRGSKLKRGDFQENKGRFLRIARENAEVDPFQL